jgi:hypothetical protein
VIGHGVSVPDQDPPGWSAYAPDTIAIAETPDPPFDYIIDRQPDGSVWLTVTDLVDERGDVTIHSSVEDAKREAARVSGDPNLRWSKPAEPSSDQRA